MTTTKRAKQEVSLVDALRELVDIPALIEGANAFHLPSVAIRPRGKKGILYLFVGGERGPSLKTTNRSQAEVLKMAFVGQLLAERLGVVNKRRTSLSTVAAWNLKIKQVPRVADARAAQNLRERRNEFRRLAPFIVDRTIEDVTPTWAKEAEMSMLVAGYAPGTARSTLSAFKTALREYAAHAQIVLQPLFRLPPPPPLKERVFTHEEFERIVGVGEGFVWDAENDRWAEDVFTDPTTGQTVRERLRHPERLRARYAMGLRLFLLSLFTGTRHAALVDVRWIANTSTGWIDIEAGVLHRDGSSGRVRSNKGVGPALFFENLRTILMVWRKEDLDRGINSVIHRTDEGAGYGRPYSSDAYVLWRSLLEAAGIDASLTPHACKKTLASWMRLGQVPGSAAASYLSTTIRTLGRYYEAVDRMHEQVPAARMIDRMIGDGIVLPHAQVRDANRYARTYIPQDLAAQPRETREALGVFIDPRERVPVRLSSRPQAHLDLLPGKRDSLESDEM